MAPSLFPTTRRSVIVALTSADAAERTRAFDTLVAIYWKPLYKYARVAHRRDAADAEDATQSFLARMYERNALASYDSAKASFRTFLRTLFDRHIANEVKASLRLKRAPHPQPLSRRERVAEGRVRGVLSFASVEQELANERDPAASPDGYFQREWVRSVFALAVDRLRHDANAIDFALFEAYDLDDSAKLSYRELAARFDISETTVTNRLAAARRKFRALMLDVLREATASEREFRTEVRALLGVDAS